MIYLEEDPEEKDGPTLTFAVLVVFAIVLCVGLGLGWLWFGCNA